MKALNESSVFKMSESLGVHMITLEDFGEMFVSSGLSLLDYVLEQEPDNFEDLLLRDYIIDIQKAYNNRVVPLLNGLAEMIDESDGE